MSLGRICQKYGLELKKNVDREKHFMNILVIGNGFDLAHGLPTKYGDFLEWVKVISQVAQIEYGKTLEEVDWGNINLKIKDLIIDRNIYRDKGFFPRERICNELLDDNFWVNYFLQCNMYQKENWIDFESEISRVIRTIDDDMKRGQYDENMVVRRCTESFLKETFLNDYEHIEQERDLQAYKEIKEIEETERKKWSIGKESEYLNKYREEHPIKNLKDEITYKQMITRLENDLDKLIRALEIYISEFVEYIRGIEIRKDILGLNPDHVLSFNYTDIFESKYGKGKQVEYDYIHGRADINNTLESNNMVLGIDEYLDNTRKDKDIEFIAFKKYYQRIYKGTGCKYKDWLYEIKESGKSTKTKLNTEYPIQIPFIKFNNNGKHKLFIFGHSLDVTDKDVLRDLILNDNVYTEIFCVDKRDLKRKIANLVKVIGQDELVKRTGGSTKTIEFKQIIEE